MFEMVTGVCSECRLSTMSPILERPETRISTALQREEIHVQPPTQSTNTIFLAAALVAIVLAAGFWFLRQGQISDAYVNAVAECKAGRGTDSLYALDQVHGSDAQPLELRFAISVCQARQALDNLDTLNGLKPTN